MKYRSLRRLSCHYLIIALIIMLDKKLVKKTRCSRWAYQHIRKCENKHTHTVVRSHFHRPTFSVLFGTDRRTDHALRGLMREPFAPSFRFLRSPTGDVKGRKRMDEIRESLRNRIRVSLTLDTSLYPEDNDSKGNSLLADLGKSQPQWRSILRSAFTRCIRMPFNPACLF